MGWVSPRLVRPQAVWHRGRDSRMSPCAASASSPRAPPPPRGCLTLWARVALSCVTPATRLCVPLFGRLQRVAHCVCWWSSRAAALPCAQGLREVPFLPAPSSRSVTVALWPWWKAPGPAPSGLPLRPLLLARGCSPAAFPLARGRSSGCPSLLVYPVCGQIQPSRPINSGSHWSTARPSLPPQGSVLHNLCSGGPLTNQLRLVYIMNIRTFFIHKKRDLRGKLS